MRFYPFRSCLSIVAAVGVLTYLGNFPMGVAVGNDSENQSSESLPKKSTDRRHLLAEEINRHLDLARETVDSSARRKLLTEAVAGIRKQSSFNVLAMEQFSTLEKALAESESDEKVANRLRDALRAVRDVYLFEPTLEAPLPEGFPDPLPLGEIRIKQYPAYRLARAVDGNEGRAFNQLFAHIQRNNIEMTSPVEMTFEKNDSGDMKSLDMAFLYHSRKLGKAGADRSVQVLDVAPLMVVAIGCRGSTDRARIGEANTRLTAWLDANRERYAVAGPVRLMGYNSPFVAEPLRFYEVEIPIQAVSQNSTNPGQKP